MISDQELQKKEAEIQALFGPAPTQRKDPPLTSADERRVDEILGRVKVESLVKESATFLFRSFGITLSGVARVLLPSDHPAEELPDSDDTTPADIPSTET